MTISNKAKLLIVTPVFILLSHYIVVFFHEYAHSFTAWILGWKNNPLAINYGGTSWLNLLLLIHIDEHVNYSALFTTGHTYQVALIACAGPLIGNGLLFILSWWLLSEAYIKQRLYLYYFLFLFNLMNLGNLYDYIPIRTFSTHGDINHLVSGLAISPWWIYILGGYLVAVLIWHFFSTTLIIAFITLKLTSTIAKASLMILSTAVLFGFFAIPGFFHAEPISYFLAATSFLAIPGLIIALWPTRDWVKRKENYLYVSRETYK